MPSFSCRSTSAGTRRPCRRSAGCDRPSAVRFDADFGVVIAVRLHGVNRVVDRLAVATRALELHQVRRDERLVLRQTMVSAGCVSSCPVASWPPLCFARKAATTGPWLPSAVMVLNGALTIHDARRLSGSFAVPCVHQRAAIRPKRFDDVVIGSPRSCARRLSSRPILHQRRRDDRATSSRRDCPLPGSAGLQTRSPRSSELLTSTGATSANSLR
jgi:hypothetical protein